MRIPRLFSLDLPLWSEVLIVVLGGVATTLAGLLIGGIVLPVLQLLAIIYVFILEVYRRRLWRAAGLVLLWSLVLTITVAGYTYSHGCVSGVGDKVIKGRSYLEEMIHWLKTGKGAEGDPSLFIIPKIVEITVFTAVSFTTAGIAGLFMGAILLNYMNYYYGTLIWMANGNPIAVIMGWPIYAVIRVVGYVFLGTVLARFTMDIAESKSFRINIDPSIKKMVIIALLLITLDFILKGTIANSIYNPILHGVVDQDKIIICSNT